MRERAGSQSLFGSATASGRRAWDGCRFSAQFGAPLDPDQEVFIYINSLVSGGEKVRSRTFLFVT